MAGRNIAIHQFHSGSGVADAVTNAMLFVQSILRDLGFVSEVFAQHVDAAVADRIRPLGHLDPAPDDVLLIHHSMGHDILARLAQLRCRKFLVYHNITPPRFFAEGDAYHHYAIKGYRQLHEYREVVEGAIAVSEVNAGHLRRRGYGDVAVIPLLRDFIAIRDEPYQKAPYYDVEPVFRLLFVGRVVPHKCQDELIDFVGRVGVIGGLPLELVLVGHFADNPEYKLRLDQRSREFGLGERVRLTGRISDAELYGWYRATDAYVSLSEHEGFGVPLIEAMAFDLPVVAFAAPGVAETLAGAGIVLADKEPASLAAPLSRLAADRSFRAATIRGQRRRLQRFGGARIAAELRQWLASIGLEVPAPRVEPETPAAGRTHYVVEGPYETSYSLALVNRNLALALDGIAGAAAHIEPAEGVEDYVVDTAAAARLPDAVRTLVGAPPAAAERVVTIRNMYPPRPNGMLGDRRLVHLAWEESAIPPALAAMMNAHLDAVLVPTEYCKRVIRNSGVRLPIAVIGHGIDHDGAPPPMPRDRALRGTPNAAAPFVFLHISAGPPRKGIEELVCAYCMAFSARDPVLLVIKTYDNPDNVIDEWVDRLTEGNVEAPAIQIISQELDALEIELLYNLADAVVLPARGEGFNLPAAEAMAYGLPVIVTRHSGQLDFCNDGNAFLVGCDYEQSTSHLHVPDSLWARARLDELVAALREVYRDARSPESATAARARQARRDALRLSWRAVAERVDAFVRLLDERPVMARKIRLAWISTYNARCGIAAHSQHLLAEFDRDNFEIAILADDQPPLAPDPPAVERLWSQKKPALAALRDHLISGGYDAVLFQHNFGFYEFAEFAGVLQVLQQAGIDTYVVLHRTEDRYEQGRLVKSLRQIAPALSGCNRLLVHGVDDVNRLHEFGLTDNVVLLPHGVIDRPPLDSRTVRLLLGLQDCTPVIGTFGFLLPGKGLQPLICAFALLLRRYPNALLLMLNADFPADGASRREREECTALIDRLGIAGRVRLVYDFLETEEVLFMLSACDAVVYPYQRTEESASGAVRLGLAAGRPVAVTALPIFADCADIVYRLPGIGAIEIAEGIEDLLENEAVRSQLLQRQRQWLHEHSWARQAGRIAGIMRGMFEERHGAEQRAPATVSIAAPSVAGAARAAEGRLIRTEHVAAAERFLRRRPLARRAERDAESADGAAVSGPVTAPEPQRKLPRRGVAALLPPITHKSKARELRLRADRARDTGDFVAAARLYRQALSARPQNASIWVQYGHALKESGDAAAAEAAYRKSLALAPEIADTHLQLGHALHLQGRRGDAAAAYLHALTLDPELGYAARELIGLGWSEDRIARALRRAQAERRR